MDGIWYLLCTQVKSRRIINKKEWRSACSLIRIQFGNNINNIEQFHISQTLFEVCRQLFIYWTKNVKVVIDKLATLAISF